MQPTSVGTPKLMNKWMGYDIYDKAKCRRPPTDCDIFPEKPAHHAPFPPVHSKTHPQIPTHLPGPYQMISQKLPLQRFSFFFPYGKRKKGDRGRRSLKSRTVTTYTVALLVPLLTLLTARDLLDVLKEPISADSSLAVGKNVQG